MSPRTARRPSLADFEVATATVPPVDDRLVHRVPISSITPSPRNPRQRMGNIAEFADSLREHGLLEPVVVRRLGTGYELIGGHRRVEAAKLLGWTEINANVLDVTEDQAYILTLVENLQREDLTPREEAAALEVLVRERSWSTRQVGEAIKRSHMYVSKRLRVFDDPVLAAPVLEEQLAVSTAEELLRVPDDEREQFIQQAIDERWGQAEARQAVRDWKVTFQSGQPSPRLAARMRALADELADVETASLSNRERREVRRLQEVLARLSAV